MSQSLGMSKSANMPQSTSERLHAAIIMDGNGRWASTRGLPRVAGHKAGAEALRRTVEAAPDLDSLRSAENYVGYERTEGFASPGGVTSDQRRVYTVPTRLKQAAE